MHCNPASETVCRKEGDLEKVPSHLVEFVKGDLQGKRIELEVICG